MLRNTSQFAVFFFFASIACLAGLLFLKTTLSFKFFIKFFGWLAKNFMPKMAYSSHDSNNSLKLSEQKNSKKIAEQNAIIISWLHKTEFCYVHFHAYVHELFAWHRNRKMAAYLLIALQKQTLLKSSRVECFLWLVR